MFYRNRKDDSRPVVSRVESRARSEREENSGLGAVQPMHFRINPENVLGPMKRGKLPSGAGVVVLVIRDRHSSVGGAVANPRFKSPLVGILG